MSVSPDQREAVVTYVQAQAPVNAKPQLLRLLGLNSEWDYEDEATGIAYGGDELMARGLRLAVPWGDYTSQQFHLVAKQ